MNQTELLNDLYYKQHNYDGIDILYKKAKAFDNSIKKEFVKDWLNKQHKKVPIIVLPFVYIRDKFISLDRNF